MANDLTFNLNVVRGARLSELSLIELAYSYTKYCETKKFDHKETMQNLFLNTIACLISFQSPQYQIVASGALEVMQSMFRDEYDFKHLTESFISGALGALVSRTSVLGITKLYKGSIHKTPKYLP